MLDLVPGKAAQAPQQQDRTFTSLTGDVVIVRHRAPGHLPHLPGSCQPLSGSLPGSQAPSVPARPVPEHGSHQPRSPRLSLRRALEPSRNAQPAQHQTPAADLPNQKGRQGRVPPVSNAQAAAPSITKAMQPSRAAEAAAESHAALEPGEIMPARAPVPVPATIAQGTGSSALQRSYFGLEPHTAPVVPVPATEAQRDAEVVRLLQTIQVLIMCWLRLYPSPAVASTIRLWQCICHSQLTAASYIWGARPIMSVSTLHVSRTARWCVMQERARIQAQNESIAQLWRTWCSAGGTLQTRHHTHFADRVAQVRCAGQVLWLTLRFSACHDVITLKCYAGFCAYLLKLGGARD